MDRNVVIILGAGASVSSGLPVLSRLFDDQAARTFVQGNAEAQSFFQEKFWDRRGINLDSASQGQSLEDMMTWLLRTHPDGIESARKSEEYRKQRYFLDQVAYHALAVNKTSIDGAYNDLIRWAEDFADSVTVGSFNWDLMFESSYYKTIGKNPQLAVSLRGWRPNASTTTLLKLHGSLSWWQVGSDLAYKSYAHYGGRPSALQQAWSSYSPSSPDRPMIMEPSAAKSSAPEFHELGSQWDYLENSLRKATHIISIGYSWPANDIRIQEVCTRVLSQTGKGLKILDVNLIPNMDRTLHSLPVRISSCQMGMSDFVSKLTTHSFNFE